jgi:hypothetical protein
MLNYANLYSEKVHLYIKPANEIKNVITTFSNQY